MIKDYHSNKADSCLVHQLLENSARELPEKVALICGSQEYTYRDIDQSADKIASRLIENQLKPQDRVVVYLANSYESITAIFGILKAGGVFVILHPGTKARKLKYILEDTGANGLITDQSKLKTVKKAVIPDLPIKHIFWDGYQEIKDEVSTIAGVLHHNLIQPTSGDTAAHKIIAPTIDVDLAALIYTSGSTGYPRGIMCAHYNMITAVRSINAYIKNCSDDVILNVLPLSFDYGLYQILLAFQVGATVVLERSFAYPYMLLELINSRKITGFPIVPMIAAILSKLDKGGKLKFRTLRYITNTGDTLSVDLIQKLKIIFPSADIYSMYGLTECKRVSYMPPEKLLTKPTSVGIPIPNTQAYIVDEQGKKVVAGQIGELVVRGSHVMQGYWRSPKHTHQAFKPGATRADTLLHTGDLFRQDDDGYLYFIGRMDDIIKHRGERISPKEIEMFLNSFEEIEVSAVISVPDSIKGNKIVAYVLPKKDSNLTSEHIYEQCRDHLEDLLIPEYIVIDSVLPYSQNGKIDKKRLLTHFCKNSCSKS